MTPRLLREFRIDDNSSVADADDFEDRNRNPFRESDSIGQIATFNQAQEWMPRLGLRPPPDLLLIDVNFDTDPTDPFQWVPKRPFGLLYAMCALIEGRVLGRPFGFAFHTVDAGIWLRPETDPTMRNLAVMFVALNAALVGGEPAELIQAEDLQKAVDWLGHARRSPADHLEARPVAAERFRKTLQHMADPTRVSESRLVVNPANHMKLLGVCDALAVLPPETPVRDHELLHQFGVLVEIDGKPDCYSISGLFPGVRGGLLAGDFRVSADSSARKAKLAPAPVEPWRFDGLYPARPSVRAYIESLGNWSTVYKEAEKVVSKLGDGRETNDKTIVQMVKLNQPGGSVIRFLALAFWIVRQYREAWNNWNHQWRYGNCVPWDPEDEENERARPLRKWLEDIVSALRETEEGHPDELAEVLELRGWESPWGSWRIGTDDIGSVEKFVDKLANDSSDRETSPDNALHLAFLSKVRDQMDKVERGDWRTKAPSGKVESRRMKDKSAETRRTRAGREAVDEKKALIAKRLNKAILALAESAGGDDLESSCREHRARLEAALGKELRPAPLLAPYLRQYLSILVDGGFIRAVYQAELCRYEVIVEGDALAEAAPRQPAEFGPEWLSSTALVRAAGLGYYTDGIDDIEQAVNVPDNTLKKMIDGEATAPNWLISLCQTYAKDGLSWNNPTGWPAFMQR